MSDISALSFPRSVKLRDDGAVTLRLLERSDRHALLSFASQLPEHDTLFLRSDITDPSVIDEWIENIERGRTVTIMAEADGNIVGYASLHMSNARWSQHVGELRVITAERQRGRGLGRTLTEAVFAVALERGLEKMVAQMTLDQHRAIATFEHLGFKSEALLRDHVKDRTGKKHDLLVLSHDVASFHSQLSAYGLTSDSSFL